MKKPVVGITADIGEGSGRLRAQVGLGYAESVVAAGGTPLVLPPILAALPEHLGLCDAFILTGGDDPRMEPFGGVTHPKATLMNAQRQEYEVRLLAELEKSRETAPVLGICLGMQLMSLLAGGAMDQYMPETMGDGAAAHYGKEHGLVVAEGLSVLRGGNVHSHHRQRITDAGRLRVLATAADGVIEAVGDPARPFYVGVQWHPERTVDAACGIDVFRAMMAAVRRA